MAKQEKLKLRGAEMRTFSMDIMSDGKACCYSQFSCEITPELADRMGWEIYTKDAEGNPGHLIGGLEGQTKLEGEINIEAIEIRLNGTKGTAVECVASKAGAFTLTRKKAEAGGIDTKLRLELVSTDWESISKYFGNMGHADGYLVLFVLPETAKMTESQMKLGEEPSEDDADESGESEGDEDNTAPLASATHMRKRNMRPTMEKIQ